MIKPTTDEIYHFIYPQYTDDYPKPDHFTLVRKSDVEYEVHDLDGPCIDQVTTLIIKHSSGTLWRIIFTYNSWGDDKIDIVGPVNEFQVINYEYLTEEEYFNIEKQGRIIKW